jgi:hypothetical protein
MSNYLKFVSTEVTEFCFKDKLIEHKGEKKITVLGLSFSFSDQVGTCRSERWGKDCLTKSWRKVTR